MGLCSTRKVKSTTGFESLVSVYQAQNCTGCPLRGSCFKGKGNRKISVNHRLNVLRDKARELLESESGKAIYAHRSVDVESCFGNIKWNANFKRFLLRGLSKVKVEMGLLCLAQNIKKWAVIRSFSLWNFVDRPLTLQMAFRRQM